MFLYALKQLEKNTFNLLLQAQQRPTFLLSVECSYPSLSRTTSDAISYISVDYVIINSVLHIHVYHIKLSLTPATDVSLISMQKKTDYVLTSALGLSDAAHEMNHLAFIHMKPGSVRIRILTNQRHEQVYFPFAHGKNGDTIQKGLHKSLRIKHLL